MIGWIVHFVAVLALALGMTLVSWVVGQRHVARARDECYESGIPPTGSARQRVSARFYVIALLFVLFDLETAFLLVWAVASRDSGVPGFLGFLVFLGLLVVGLGYEWREGALDWGRSPRAEDRARRAREGTRKVET